MPLATLEDKRAYQRLWIARRRAEYFQDKMCAKCPNTVRLELDHIDHKTKVTHKIWSWSKERRDAELAKCQILCYECHKEKTRGDAKEIFTRPITHGTETGYKDKKCRCNECKLAYKIKRREKYLRTGT